MAARGFGEILNSGRSRFPELRCQKGSQKVAFSAELFCFKRTICLVAFKQDFYTISNFQATKSPFFQDFYFSLKHCTTAQMWPRVTRRESLITVNESRNMKGGEEKSSRPWQLSFPLISFNLGFTSKQQESGMTGSTKLASFEEKCCLIWLLPPRRLLLLWMRVNLFHGLVEDCACSTL